MPIDSTPLISIVLPTFNGARYIAESIQSCLSQTYQNLEIIIVVDGSTDNTLAIINSLNDPRIRVKTLGKNQGHIHALNIGFKEAQGRYVTWTSDDNFYHHRALELMQGAIVANNVDFVYTRYFVIDEDGLILREGRVEEPDYLDTDNCIGGCFLYTRHVYEKVGDFNQKAFLAEDYEYWLRVRAKFRMMKFNMPLYYYRQHAKSLTGVYKEMRVQEQVQKVRERFLPFWKKLYFKLMKLLRRFKNDYFKVNK